MGRTGSGLYNVVSESFNATLQFDYSAGDTSSPAPKK